MVVRKYYSLGDASESVMNAYVIPYQEHDLFDFVFTD
jgi:hypothetical protein